MRKTTLTIAAAALMLALAGCSAAVPANGHAPRADTASEPSASPTAAPITISSNQPAPTPSASANDATYLKEVRIRLKGMDATTDAQLVSGAHLACQLYAKGQTKNEIRVVKGAAKGEPSPNWNNGVIATWAAFIYCPQYKP